MLNTFTSLGHWLQNGASFPPSRDDGMEQMVLLACAASTWFVK